jgi:hypothetical protein
MDTRENEEKVGNVGREHDSVSSEYKAENGKHEDNEAERVDRNGEEKKASDFKMEINSINLRHITSSNIYFLSHVCSNKMKLIHKIPFPV